MAIISLAGPRLDLSQSNCIINIAVVNNGSQRYEVDGVQYNMCGVRADVAISMRVDSVLVWCERHYPIV